MKLIHSLLAPKIRLNPHSRTQRLPGLPTRGFRIVERHLNAPWSRRSPQAPLGPPRQFLASMEKPYLMNAPLFLAESSPTGLDHAQAAILRTRQKKDQHLIRLPGLDPAHTERVRDIVVQPAPVAD